MNEGLNELITVATSAVADIVIEVLEPTPYKRRLVFRDGSFLDIYLSSGRKKKLYAFHYERRHLDGTLFRVDNYPHHRALRLPGFPHHWHERTDARVRASGWGKNPRRILVNFLAFIRQQLLK